MNALKFLQWGVQERCKRWKDLCLAKDCPKRSSRSPTIMVNELNGRGFRIVSEMGALAALI